MMRFSAAGSTPLDQASSALSGQALLALLALVVIIAGGLGVRAMIRTARVRKAREATGGRFTDYVLEALVNAAKVDGRITDSERAAIAAALAEATGAAVDPPVLDNALTHARLSKDELVAFLADRASGFSHAQNAALLKALVSVFMADGHFDETEHHALVDYTAAVGYDRQSAPDVLRSFARSMQAGHII